VESQACWARTIIRASTTMWWSRESPLTTTAAPVRVGITLPDDGPTYYDVPPEFHVAPGYRYTVVDNEPVIVDHTYHVVEVIE